MEILFILFINIAPLLILLSILSVARKSLTPLKPAAYLCLFIAVDILLVLSPKILGFSSFQWNWEGKVLSILWSLTAIYLFHWISKEDAGLYLPKKNSAWSLALLLTLFFVLIDFSTMLYHLYFNEISIDDFPVQKFNPGTFAYQ